MRDPISSEIPVICDMSSCILSEEVDFHNLDLVYAGPHIQDQGYENQLLHLVCMKTYHK